MPRRKRRPIFIGYTWPRLSKGRRLAVFALLAVLLFLLALIPPYRYLNSLMGRYGVSYVRDSLMIEINDAVNGIMAAGDYQYDYFVILEKDDTGNITALKSDMAHINALSSKLIRDIVEIAEAGDFDVMIPFGSLTGVNVMSGHGPMVPIKIVMLTSSKAAFKNSFFSAGINQTAHQVILEISVDIDILVPWDTVSTMVTTEIIVADTIIVGRVPDTYLDLGK